MNTTQPIRNTNDLDRIKNYYKNVSPNSRNYLLIVLGLNTALRISDELSLKWEDVFDFSTGEFLTHISLAEKKTGKAAYVYLNSQVLSALSDYKSCLPDIKPHDYIFLSRKNKEMPITRVQAFRVIKKAVNHYSINDTISCHSLRKTFGYHAWKQGASPVVLMSIYNHSSYSITKRYLGIEQDDKDEIYKNIVL